MTYNLNLLSDIAENYKYNVNDLPISFDGEPYTRTTIFGDDNMEIVVICFRQGQTSSVHDHQGSNCVVHVVQGRLLETLFSKDDEGQLHHLSHHYVEKGNTSGLDGMQVHQLAALDPNGTVLLNFYSPPFKV